MAARGDIEAPHCAIFADTQSEPAAVYRHLDWLEGQLPFPVHRVTVGSLRDAMTAGDVKRTWGRPPLFVRNRKTGAVGFTNRQCTQDYKLIPIRRKVRELLGMKPGQQARVFLGLKRSDPVPAIVEQWIGISTDEIVRLKASREPWVQNRHILVEARMSREDCKCWLLDRQYPIPPKSACAFCPYHTNTMWRDIRDNDPEAWAMALEVDEAVSRGLPGLKEGGFLHRSLKRLADAPIDAEDVPGFDFANECEGVCEV